MKDFISYLLLLSVLFLYACTLSKGDIDAIVKEEKTKAPQQWSSKHSVKGTIDTLDSGWLDAFEDSQLKAIVIEAVSNNYDVQAASAKLEKAKSKAKKAGSYLAPTVDLKLSGKDGGTLEDKSTGESKNTATEASYGASLDISWELDVWGRIRAGRDAATDDYIASKADFDYAYQSLAAQTAKAYLLSILTKLQKELTIADVNHNVNILEIVKVFFEKGAGEILDIHLAKSELAKSQDAVHNAEKAYLESLRSLELLLGRYPSAELKVAKKLPPMPKPVAAGIPSDILERRPDLISAERRVAAAFNRTLEAKAAQLPRISLTASFGTSSSDLSLLTDPTNIFWNLAGNLLAPIFDKGKREADVEIATAEQKESLAIYKKAALSAFGEVEKALTNEYLLRKRENSLREAYMHAKQAAKIKSEKYNLGMGNILDVQEVKQKVIYSEKELLYVQYDLLVQRINLYLALGGDFAPKQKSGPKDLNKPLSGKSAIKKAQ